MNKIATKSDWIVMKFGMQVYYINLQHIMESKKQEKLFDNFFAHSFSKEL